MKPFNDILMCLEHGTRTAIWYGFIAFSAVVLSILQYSYSKKAHSGKPGLAAFLSLITFGILAVLTYTIEDLTQGLVIPSGSIYYVPYLLMVSAVLKKVLHIPFVSALDHTAIANVLARAVTITGCSFAGCCQGYPVHWGIYSAVQKTTAIPMRAIEQVALLILWYALHRYYRCHSYNTHGRCAAAAMMAFGLINVVADIFTVEYKLFCVTSIEGIFGFGTFCAGLILLYLLQRKQTPTNIPAMP